MLTVRPDFYDAFRCLASACRHSCCVGWEIDVDGESLAYYDALPGPLGEELRREIEHEPTPHFRLTAGERCPFLQADGLCRLILALGEEGLCDICAMHPRFFNEYPGRLEMGLGLCCEEAGWLLTAGKGPLRLIAEDDGEGEGEQELTELLRLRERIFAVLEETSRPFAERMEAALALLNLPLLPFNGRESAAFFLTLERMDTAWTALLCQLAAAPEPPPRPAGVRYMRIAEYLVYRHFASAEDEAEAGARLQFCFHAVCLICALERFSGEALRLFSAEIEYSDENVDKICRWLMKQVEDKN